MNGLMIGTTISHYKILEKLGEGGMGVVYKAEDIKLKRIVALKFLPQHLTKTQEEQARFLQEAQAAATLNHPNVCAIHTIEEVDGLQFIDMEFVDGETLRSKLSVSKLKTSDALAYALQIGDALQEAHSKGIVHRDVKPENMMVNSKNQVKVMDFGLAKLKGSLKLTRTSSTVGTVAYMAPEQVQGGEVDARSDIFSFGVVLFEMLTGHSPFRGEHEAAIIYSVVNEEPDALTKYLPDASSELTHILSRALEKDPEDRYQTVHDMVIDLRRLKKETSKVFRSGIAERSASEPMPTSTPAPPRGKTTTSVTINIPTWNTRSLLFPGLIVGVLVLLGVGYLLFFRGSSNGQRIPVVVADFVNDTKESELDGLSGMLITALEQSRRLDVLPRSRMFDMLKVSGKANIERIDENLGKEICSQAGINSLLLTSIRKFGKVYTIDLKVVDPKDGKYLFTATETGEGQESVPALLDKLSQKTREGFKENRSEIQLASKSVAEITTSNMQAYQHFFQGEQLMNRVKFLEAQEEYNKAVALDTSFGLAYYRLSYATSWQTGGQERAKIPLQKAMAHLDRIPEKERFLLRAQEAEIYRGFGSGIAVLREMEKVYPNEKEMLYNIGDWSYHAGDLEVAAEYLEKVLSMDPAMERVLEHLCWTYRDSGQYERFLDIARRYVSASGSDEAYSLLGTAYRRKGDLDNAMKTFKQLRELFPKNYAIVSQIAQTHLDLGNYGEAESELKKLVGDGMPVEAKRIGYQQLSYFYPLIGKYREALRMLDRRAELYWQAADTGQTATMYSTKAFYILLGWNQSDKAWRELQYTSKYHQTVTYAPYWSFIFEASLLRGDFALADSLAKKWYVGSKLLVHLGEAQLLSAQGSCDKAEALVDSLGNASGFWKILALYPLARCQLSHDNPDKAIASLKKLQIISDYAWGFRGLYFAKSFYLLGTAYEKKGDKKLAGENFDQFLRLWKNADNDLPELIDAKARLSRLKALTAK